MTTASKYQRIFRKEIVIVSCKDCPNYESLISKDRGQLHFCWGKRLPLDLADIGPIQIPEWCPLDVI